MSFSELNKIAGAFLGALLLFLLLGFFSAKMLGTDEGGHHSDTLAFALEIEEDESAESAEAEDAGLDLFALASAADASAGAGIFRQCQACHKIEDGANGVGPHLWDVVGRAIGGVDGYSYSNTLAEMGGEWNVEALLGFLEDPRGWAPGTKMAYNGLSDPEDRINLIAYLNEEGGSNLDLTDGLADDRDASAADVMETETDATETAEAPTEEAAETGDASTEEATEAAAEEVTETAEEAAAAAEDVAETAETATEEVTETTEAATEEVTETADAAATEVTEEAEATTEEATETAEATTEEATEAVTEEAATEEATEEVTEAAEATEEATEAAEATEEATDEIVTAAAPEAETVEATPAAAPLAFFEGVTAEDGAKVYRACRACHVLEEGKNRVGPYLYGVVGREVASVEGFRYSNGMKEHGGVWTAERLYEYLEDPRGVVKGTSMAYPGLKKSEDRAAIILYLNENSAAPLALQ
ncbi:MAG: c-type cytochrome [Pseudomonadota bacterium]